MLNIEEPINLMLRTSLEVLTVPSYDAIRWLSYEEIILVWRASSLKLSWFLNNQLSIIICVIASPLKIRVKKKQKTCLQ